MNKRKLKKNLIKLKSIIYNNHEKIKKMIVSDTFLESLIHFPEVVECEIIENEDGLEISYLYGIPIHVSHFMHNNLVLEMKDGELIVIKIGTKINKNV